MVQVPGICRKEFIMKIKNITEIGLTAAAYAVLTMIIAPIGFGAIQCRISDVLLFFCSKNKNLIGGCAIGCIIVNMLSPLGVIDMVLGGIVNILIGLTMYKVKRATIKVPICSFIAGLIIGAELTLISGAPFIFTVITVAIGEAVALSIGGVLYKIMEDKKIQLWQDQGKK